MPSIIANVTAFIMLQYVMCIFPCELAEACTFSVKNETSTRQDHRNQDHHRGHEHG